MRLYHAAISLWCICGGIKWYQQITIHSCIPLQYSNPAEDLCKSVLGTCELAEKAAKLLTCAGMLGAVNISSSSCTLYDHVPNVLYQQQ